MSFYTRSILLAAALLLPCASRAETADERLMQATFKVFNTEPMLKISERSGRTL